MKDNGSISIPIRLQGLFKMIPVIGNGNAIFLKHFLLLVNHNE